MKSIDFLNMLKKAHDVPNYYNNKYPRNLGYYDGKQYSFDCWNLIKAVLSGWNASGVVGSYVHPEQLVTGDCDGQTLLNRCTQRSKDFSKISVPGTYMYLSSDPHAGVYIGDVVVDGKTYNCIECTKNSWGNGVLYTYVDKDGTRRQYKGSSSTKLKWSEYGLLTPYVEYDNVQASPSENTSSYPVLSKGSQGEYVKKLQTLLVSKGYNPNGVDGVFGPGCEKAVKQYQKDKGLTVDGIVGPKTWDSLLAVEKPIEVPKEEPKNDKPILKKGSKGGSVNELKMLLINHGEVPFDNVFDDSCLKAVKEFQKKHGLEVDGCVGPKTWAELLK